MKKIPLVSKCFLVILGLLFCSIVVFADDERVPIVLKATPTDNVPKTVNVQGRYTKSYGDPYAKTNIDVKYQFSSDGRNWGRTVTVSTTTDAEGLYDLALDASNFSSTTRYFRVSVGPKNGAPEPSGDGYSLTSSPYSFYASSATWAQGDSKNQMIADTYIKDLKIHQTSMTIINGNGTPTPKYFIKTSTKEFGIVKVGSGLDVTEGVISVNSGVHVETATYAQKDYRGNEITSYYEPKGNVTSKGSASLPIYFDASGVAQTITSY
ncbi:MAG: hypothetical protein IKN62_01030, partial [Elusimicrobia bacterium]|nr:hypothetical protein [Elusimicrobiota bacterium]